MLNKLMIALGIRKDVGAPVHVGCSPVYFTYVYKDEEDDWVFSWHDADHKQGGQTEFCTESEAHTARVFWEGKKSLLEHATFVRP